MQVGTLQTDILCCGEPSSLLLRNKYSASFLYSNLPRITEYHCNSLQASWMVGSVDCINLRHVLIPYLFLVSKHILAKRYKCNHTVCTMGQYHYVMFQVKTKEQQSLSKLNSNEKKMCYMPSRIRKRYVTYGLFWGSWSMEKNMLKYGLPGSPMCQEILGMYNYQAIHVHVK